MGRFGVASTLLLGFLALANADSKDPKCEGGRTGIVQLFGWRWDDIAIECEEFLGPYGFCGVQTSPAAEHRIVENPNRPWWERYQPVSYKIETRSGSEEDFKNMVKTCNDKGVRVFVDVVVNHMARYGTNGNGTAGTSYDAVAESFPGVPYDSADFHNATDCPTTDGIISNYQDPVEVRNCRLEDLIDLKTECDDVRGKLAEYLDRLVDMGVAGFRIDAAKHMMPIDIAVILGLVKDVQQGGRPFVYQQVIDLGFEAIKGNDYLNEGRVTNFRFGFELGEVFRKRNAMKWLSNWGRDWGMWESDDVVNFLDNHDTQRGQGGPTNALTHLEARAYKLATAFMLAHPYGMPRIMSSYYFKENSDGPPHNDDMSIKNVIHDGNLCRGGWVCEHRWRQIYNMVAFRNMAGNSSVANWWSGSDYQIAFSRDDKAFIALNLEDFELFRTLQTGLPGGIYCDVISGNLVNNTCTGSEYFVENDGTSQIQVCSGCDDPMVALHIGAKVDSMPIRF